MSDEVREKQARPLQAFRLVGVQKDAFDQALGINQGIGVDPTQPGPGISSNGWL